MSDLKESMQKLPPDMQARVALHQLVAVQTHVDQIGPREIVALYNVRNILKSWINTYGEFVPALLLDDPKPTEEWQVYAEQVSDIIAPVTAKGDAQNIETRIWHLYEFLKENKLDMHSALSSYKPLKENAPE